jgi:uncharacterized protein (DUF169 family)
MSTNWTELSPEFQRLLRLRTYPVGVRLCPSEEELTQGRVPAVKLTLCQMIKGAAHASWQLACPREQMGCFTAQLILGFRQQTEKDVEHHMRQFTDDEQVARRMIENKPKLPFGQMAGVLTGPLGGFPPDVVVFVVDALQALGLIEAYTYSTGESLSFVNGVSSAACSYGVVAAYQSGKPNLAIPCVGAKRYGQLQDNELLFTVPLAAAETMLANAQAMERGGKWPIPIVGGFLSPTIPVNYVLK